METGFLLCVGSPVRRTSEQLVLCGFSTTSKSYLLTTTTTSLASKTTIETTTAITTTSRTTTEDSVTLEIFTTTTQISCEDYLCQEGNGCPSRKNTEDKCSDFYTGDNCEIPPKFVRQMNPFNSEEYMKVNFITALNWCRIEGGYLAFFINDEEFDSYITDLDRHVQEYIGYVTCDHPNFVNADGYESRYESWDVNQPDNKDGIEFCVGISTNDKMNDVPCNQMLEFTCRLPRS